MRAERRRGHTEGMQEPPQAIWGAAVCPMVQRDGHLGLGRGPGTQCIPEEPAEAKEPPGWGEA